MDEVMRRNGLLAPLTGEALDDCRAVALLRRSLQGRDARPRRSLVLWSGGPHSTDALLAALAHSDDEVHVHHVSVGTCGGLSGVRSGDVPGAGLAMVARRREMERDRRAFGYSRSRLSLPFAERGGVGMSTLLHCGALAARELGFDAGDRIVLGTVPRAAASDWRTHCIRAIKAAWAGEEVPALEVGAAAGGLARVERSPRCPSRPQQVLQPARLSST